ncbi:unnamed protein product [Prorocentrum cordatum]|uniref:WAP domain-containing protein n=1 Tax=Prorocentrum cordatum TaxID=2364126 RepID=A0ABN9QBU4_9DINO|nr:unnamed protein product [Polarella glacialis]
MMAAIFRALALLHLLPRLLAASACPDAACGAGEPAEEAALLQSISRRGDARSIPAVPPSLLSGAAPAPGSAGPYPVKCYAGQSTQCPGSSDQCAGNQCCPGIPWSGGKTFPCPSATSVEASNCASSQKAWYCAASSDIPHPGGAAVPAVRGSACSWLGGALPREVLCGPEHAVPRQLGPVRGQPVLPRHPVERQQDLPVPIRHQRRGLELRQRPEGLVLRAVAAPQQSEFFGTSTWWVTGSALADVAAGYFCSPRSRSLNPPPTLAPSLFLPPFPSARWPKDRARSQSGSGASRCVAALGLNASPSHSSNGI